MNVPVLLYYGGFFAGFSVEYAGNATQSIISYFAYKAMEAGVPVVFAAGNEGPNHFTVENSEPWVMNVAAGTVDRKFTSNFKLGNGASVKVNLGFI